MRAGCVNAEHVKRCTQTGTLPIATGKSRLGLMLVKVFFVQLKSDLVEKPSD